jgi:hypothetical protein
VQKESLLKSDSHREINLVRGQVEVDLLAHPKQDEACAESVQFCGRFAQG